MRKLTKTAAIVASMAVMAMGATVITSAAQEGWVQSGSNWYYYLKGDRASNRWVQDGNDWYFIDDEGKMAKEAFIRTDSFTKESEVLDKEDIYEYLGTDDIDDDSTFYYVGRDGKMVTGWQSISASNVYASPNSDKASTLWYYFGTETGRMYVDEWLESNGEWYALSSNGQMYAEAVVNNDLEDWDDSKNYYMSSSGAMVKGWYKVTDKRTGESEGKEILSKNKWVYADENSGVIADGEWESINGKWYYFGEYARNDYDTDKNLQVLIANDEKLTLDDLQWGIVASGASAKLINDKNYDPDKADDLSSYMSKNSDVKYAMLSDTLIKWTNHSDSDKYFYLQKDGDALIGWKEIDDDYYIYGNTKGELFYDTIGKVSGRFYYFNADAVCDYKDLNDTADYAVIFKEDYEAEDLIGGADIQFYETTKKADEVTGISTYINLSDIKNSLKEKNISSVRFGSRKVKVDSLTETEAILAYAVSEKSGWEGKEVSIYKLRTSSSIEKRTVTFE